jgi:UDP-glucose 4-epimerase
MAGEKQVLVTGGAGFIGSHLVERLLADGHAVTVIDDCSTGDRGNLRAVATHPRLRFVVGKISECRELESIVASAEYVFHLAASVGVDLVVNSPISVLTNNLKETGVVLAAAAAAGVPLLLASTSEVYGKSLQAAFSEEDDLLIGPPSHSRWSYACSKLTDEFLAMAYHKEQGLPVTIARLFNTVGPRQTGRYGMVLPRFIAAAQSRQPLRVFGDGGQTRCFCYVRDTVEALVRLQRSPAARGEVFNVGGEEEISIMELARLVIDVLKSSSSVELVPYVEAYAAGFDDLRRRRPVIEKLRRAVNFRPGISLREMVELTAAG